MGLPIARILAATNANDIVARALTDGATAIAAGSGDCDPGERPWTAMDIQVASTLRAGDALRVRLGGETSRPLPARILESSAIARSGDPIRLRMPTTTANDAH